MKTRSFIVACCLAFWSVGQPLVAQTRAPSAQTRAGHASRTATLVFSGYFGGSKDDVVTASAVAANGDIVIVGTTQSSEADGFPASNGLDSSFNPFGFCSTGQGLYDAYVARIKSDGSGLVFCTYLGGTCNQVATCVALDPVGNIYVGGFTTSPPPSFPASVGPQLTQPGGFIPGDGFVAKLTADGTQLLYCGYVGGTASDAVNAIAVDATGHAYVGGYTSSKQGLPVTVGPGLTAPGGGTMDGFVAKVKADGSGFDYCGYVGGSGVDEVTTIAVDATGAAYIGGETFSGDDFPVTVGPDLTHNGMMDAFVGKIRPDGSGFTYLGYLGGANSDSVSAVAVASDGAAIVAGATDSPQTSFPVAVGPDLTFNTPPDKSNGDAYVAKVKPDGSGLVYCGYIGGAVADSATDVLVDNAGRAIVTGFTQSSESSFPVLNGPDSTLNNTSSSSDAFLSVVKPDGSGLLVSGYIGGSENDTATRVAMDASGRVIVVGGTFSVDFPTMGSFGQTRNGQHDGFVVKLNLGLGPPPPTVASVAKQGKKLVVMGEDFDRGAVILVNGTSFKTKADKNQPSKILRSGKAGKSIKSGDSVRVRNADGNESNEVVFSG